ncbi:Extradiol ring-cleavage dioxygenase, class III enzyme, subunit B [Penicillium occitanis (nom. inval.)]|nr:Extradiol ring-cleavage dioxygenase, class III enzyme, subunit B [Penicillium occitanis (nom. inval.)]PCG92118.1 hypothetical protein PENOC_094140 [Penicillium occitanis (nom. inval.)]
MGVMTRITHAAEVVRLENRLNVPIVQVSLYANEDADAHYRLGQILESLRDEGILIIGAGMAVRNTADYRATKATDQGMPYTVTFEKALTETITAKPAERQAKMDALLKRHDTRDVHPTFNHLLPTHIAAGAAGLDVGKKLWDLPEGGINWAQYRFGTV